MPWNITVVDANRGRLARVGDTFYAAHLIRDLKKGQNSIWLSREYMQQWFGVRPPIVVMLPVGHGLYPFCVDGPWRDRETKNPEFQGWTVTGVLPYITVDPSIDLSKSDGWHGHIENGVVKDDVTGKKFDDSGRKVT